VAQPADENYVFHRMAPAASLYFSENAAMKWNIFFLWCAVSAVCGNVPSQAGEAGSDSSQPKSSAIAQEQGDTAKAGKKVNSDTNSATLTKDPIELAFVLPYNVHLNGNQSKAYEDLKKKYEPLLREALDKMAGASTEAEKDKYARQAQHIHAEIRDKIDAILQAPKAGANQNAQRREAEAQKRAIQAEKAYIRRFRWFGRG
jgi:hypothetical protein